MSILYAITIIALLATAGAMVVSEPTSKNAERYLYAIGVLSVILALLAIITIIANWQ